MLYPMPLRRRLPALPIPLREGEPAVPLDLQALIDNIYARGRYNNLGYAQELDPPLTPEETVWAESLLKLESAGFMRRDGGCSPRNP